MIIAIGVNFLSDIAKQRRQYNNNFVEQCTDAGGWTLRQYKRKSNHKLYCIDKEVLITIEMDK